MSPNSNSAKEDNTSSNKVLDNNKMSNNNNSKAGEEETSSGSDRFHISSRIEKAMSRREVNTSNRSSEVLPLEREYTKMKSNIGSLKTIMKSYNMHLEKSNELRADMAMSFSKLAQGTPIQDSIGADEESPASLFKDSLFSTESSATASVGEDMSDLTKSIDFITEWEAIITDKVEGEMEDVQQLHKDLNHYHLKVDKLRTKEKAIEEKANPDGSSSMPVTAITKGVASPQKLQEKLKRNETKLDEAWKKHEAKANHLCQLLEEVTGHGWELLHHLARLVMKFESSYAESLHKNLSKLPDIMKDMTETYNEQQGEVAFGRAVIPNAVDEYDSDDTTDDESEDSSPTKSSGSSMKAMMGKIKA